MKFISIIIWGPNYYLSQLLKKHTNKLMVSTTSKTKNKKNTPLQDLAKGSIMGAFIGDACGAFLEFRSHTFKEKDVNNCMAM